MKILLVDRNVQELIGIRWYLQTYLAGDLQVEFCTNATDTATKIHVFEPDVLLINIDLLPTRSQDTTMILLQNAHCTTFAMTADPLFQNVVKAIDIHAQALWIKPIDLERFMKKLTQLKSKLPVSVTNDSFYLQLFFGEQYSEDVFLLIEPEQSQHIQKLYDWLHASILFEHVKIYPFSNWLVCLFPNNELEKDLHMLQKYWQQEEQGLLNISIYDEEPATLQQCYTATKRALEQCFYHGFGHIFYTSKKVATQSFDPLLSPRQQQQLIDSLEQLDGGQFQQFLLTIQNQFFEQEDVRVHLTSVLAQVRRYMLKYKLGQKQMLEQQYRQLFRLIIEHPILYTITNEIQYFTESLIEEVKQIKIHALASYTTLAKSIIETNYTIPSLTLTSIADQLGISSNYLSTLFAKHEQQPLKKYLQTYRIERACERLVTTSSSISEISLCVGFEDPNYFSKVFKSQKGMTPHQFRINHS